MTAIHTVFLFMRSPCYVTSPATLSQPIFKTKSNIHLTECWSEGLRLRLSPSLVNKFTLQLHFVHILHIFVRKTQTKLVERLKGEM